MLYVKEYVNLNFHGILDRYEGYFVLSPKVIDFIEDDHTVWEDVPLKTLTKQGELSAFQHSGNWRPMDTLRDKVYLENLWENGKAFWKSW